MYERLTKRQKDLLNDIVIGVREGKVEEPFQGTCYISGECYIDGLVKRYEPSIIGDLNILEKEGLLSSTLSRNGEPRYTLLQTAYDAVDNNFQEPIPIQKPISKVNSDEAFIICTFRKELEPVCEIIKKVSSEFKIKARRVDEIEGDFKITTKIEQKIVEARIIFADLSYGRPNVYYEYGYARGVGKTGSIITLLIESENMHFDVKDFTQIRYSLDDLEDLEQKLRKRISSLLNKQES